MNQVRHFIYSNWESIIIDEDLVCNLKESVLLPKEISDFINNAKEKWATHTVPKNENDEI